jgi:hypothetical protein
LEVGEGRVRVWSEWRGVVRKEERDGRTFHCLLYPPSSRQARTSVEDSDNGTSKEIGSQSSSDASKTVSASSVRPGVEGRRRREHLEGGLGEQLTGTEGWLRSEFAVKVPSFGRMSAPLAPSLPWKQSQQRRRPCRTREEQDVRRAVAALFPLVRVDRRYRCCEPGGISDRSVPLFRRLELHKELVLVPLARSDCRGESKSGLSSPRPPPVSTACTLVRFSDRKEWEGASRKRVRTPRIARSIASTTGGKKKSDSRVLSRWSHEANEGGMAIHRTRKGLECAGGLLEGRVDSRRVISRRRKGRCRGEGRWNKSKLCKRDVSRASGVRRGCTTHLCGSPSLQRPSRRMPSGRNEDAEYHSRVDARALSGVR